LSAGGASRKAAAGRPGLGRPRDADRHGAVLAATRELLRESGYSRLTIDGVAERGAVSRTLIYRWWSTKAELVQEALFPFDSGRATPDSGSFAADLRILVEHKVDSFSRPEMVRGLPGRHADLVADPELRRKTEREFRMSDLHVSLSLVPTIRMRDVYFANAPWSHEAAPMARIDRGGTPAVDQISRGETFVPSRLRLAIRPPFVIT